MAVLVPLKQRTSQLLPNNEYIRSSFISDNLQKSGKSPLSKHTGTLASLEHEVRGRILLLRLHILQQNSYPLRLKPNVFNLDWWEGYYDNTSQCKYLRLSHDRNI